MRVWDIPVSKLCDRHLLAQHAEIHAIYNIIANNKRGYAYHPEVNRWRGHLPGLYETHERTAAELRRRGMNHQSPLLPVPGEMIVYPQPIQSLSAQIELLKSKGCKCKV